MSDFAAFGADLPEARGAEVVCVDRHGRRAFGAAITFQRADAETFLKCRSQPVGQFFRCRHHHAQAAEILRRTAAQVKLQERRRGEQKGNLMLAHQRPDAFGIERIRMINHAHAQHRRQTERAGESERMEERQDAQETIPVIQSENLFELLDVRADVVVAQHHAFWLAGAAAGKNHRGQIVQSGFSVPRPAVAATSDQARTTQ